MLRTNYSGQTGNCAIQYMHARLVAGFNNYKLWNEMPVHCWLNSTPCPGGELYTGTEREYAEDWGDCSNGDPQYIMLDKKSPAYLNGLWQNTHHYTQHREQIRGFFDVRIPTKLNKEDIALHVRLGDYAKFGDGGTIVDPSYYTDILSSVNYRKAYIFTDSPRDRTYFENFAWRNCEIVDGGTTIEQFEMLMGFDRLIMGNSTYAWLAAFLGHASTVWTFGRWLRNCHNYRPMLADIGTPMYGRFLGEKTTRGLTSIIVPYRQRGESRQDLADCVEHLQKTFKDSEIIVCEQVDNKPFKKGQLVNLGFQRSQGEIIVMHDLDTRWTPEGSIRDELIRLQAPYVPFMSVDGVRKLSNWGMANVWWREHFENANGFSNLFTGWGAEDNEMHKRSKFTRTPGDIHHVEHRTPKEIVHVTVGGEMTPRNVWLLDTRHERNYRDDGWQQTDAHEISAERNRNVALYKFDNIGVDFKFLYKDWMQTQEGGIVPAIRTRADLLYSRVDLAMITYQRHKYLETSAGSLLDTVSRQRSELYLIDDASEAQKQLEALKYFGYYMHVTRNETNLGVWHNFIKAGDTMFENTRGRWFVICQDDIVFSEGWVEKADRIVYRLAEHGVDWGVLSLVNLVGETVQEYYIMKEGHSGACCLAINRDMWKSFRKSDARDGAVKASGADHRITHWCRYGDPKQQWAVCRVGKSLVKHIGVNSTLHSRKMDDFTSYGFEEIDNANKSRK